MDILETIMVYAGSVLMVYNIAHCYSFVRRMRESGSWHRSLFILYVPLILLVSFLAGYLVVGIFGDPDLVVAGILFGGSVFVFVVLGIMYDIIDRLRDEHARSEARYMETHNDLKNLTEHYLTVFRVNLTEDRIEERGGTSLYQDDVDAHTYTELVASRKERLLSDSQVAQGTGTLTRDGLLQSFAAGRSEVSETVLCRLDQGVSGFVKVCVRMTHKPGSNDEIAFITEELCNDELVTDALLNKALIGQFDMITYLIDGRYSVVIGDDAAMGRGSIFPRRRSGLYGQYLQEQVLPVIVGTERERAALVGALSPARVEVELARREPYTVNISCLIEGEVFYKRFVYYVIDWDARFFLLLKSDTTEARREEIERNALLQEALEEAQRASQSKTTFLSNMSHDIRTPMNAIVGYTDLARRSQSVDQMHGYLEKIDTSSKYLLALINDVLEMSRIESGKLDLEPEDTNLCELLESVRDMFESQMREKGIAFVVEERNVVQPWVRCDRTRFNRVLLNLLSNAYKFTPEGGQVRVVLEQMDGAPQGHGAFELRVSDTGIGMSQEFAEKVFEAFERERNTTASGIQGTGLGMAITKRIVDMMQGTIDVYSAPGKGTEFVVRVQMELAAEGAHVTGPGDGGSSSVAEDMSFEDVHILLAEDNEINREIACMLLGDLGFQIDAVENGRQAVDQLVQRGAGYYDVVVTDIQMPVMNGYEEARAIRALDDPDLAAIPIVAMSANAFAEDIQAARSAGIDGYVSKPIDVGAVIDELARVLAS
ncbi:MAG: ATP-binding protein [Coriobacteriales bacterium]|nr:ATP-binding protein [Coriobacteriales bacterium]